MRVGRSLAAGVAAALLLISAAVPATLGYQGQVAYQVTVTGPGGSISCGTPLTLTATVLDSSGKPVASRAVAWSFGAGEVAGDQIGKASTTTNAQGVTTTAVTLACVVGDRTIVATATPASGQLTIGAGQIVLGISASPVATATAVASEIATATPVASEIAVAGLPAPSAVATAAPATPTTGSSGGDVPLWVWILMALLILVLLVLVVWFILRRRGVASSS